MATILGAIATSHTPTIGFAYDRNKQDDPVWAPIFEAYKPIHQWINAKKPDVFFVIYNDHVTSFFFDHYSVFALGIDEQYAIINLVDDVQGLLHVSRAVGNSDEEKSARIASLTPGDVIHVRVTDVSEVNGRTRVRLTQLG